MRAHFKQRVRGSSISAVAPAPNSADYNPAMAKAATSILYRSPLNSKTNHPIYILNAAALPDTNEVDYDTLLPYVLARLPDEEELVGGKEYEVILFAGGPVEGATMSKRNHPGVGWFLQAYHVLSRAMRKRIQKLYIVHQRTWIRMLVEFFSTVASPKFRKKIIHASTLSALAHHINIQDILIPPSAYLRDRELSPNIHVQHTSGRRAFSARVPLPRNVQGQSRLPRVLRETTTFILLDENITTEGLFRIPPHVKLKEILREAYDRGQKFIVWKEQGVALPMPKYEHMQNVESIIGEIDQHEAYGVHLAAGLLKLWYTELREPLFPPSCYRELRNLFGNPEETPSLERLTELFSVKSEWSILPLVSREICTRHLMPVLSTVSARSQSNKMTAENLAVCFAPTLVCGPDQMEDVKISSIIRRILTAAGEMWSQGLREACGVEEEAFVRDLQAPPRIDDYEDPLYIHLASHDEPPPSSPGFIEEQKSGIIMKDNDIRQEIPPPLPPRSYPPEKSSTSESPQKTAAPPLPPRSAGSNDSMNWQPEELSVRRKPAPPLTVPPRYSTIAADPNDVTESPSTYTAVTNGFGPPRRGDWSLHTDVGGGSGESPVSATASRQGSVLKRKPVTPATSGDDAKKFEDTKM